MKIISETKEQLIVKHIPWIPLGFTVVFLLLGIIFSSTVISGPLNNYSVIIILGMPLFLLIKLANISTTTFNKTSNLVSIKHWRLIGSEQITTLKLSEIKDVKISLPTGRLMSESRNSTQIIIETDVDVYSMSKERSQFFASEKNQAIVKQMKEFIGLNSDLSER